MDLNWIKDCPKTCNCQVSHFDDLSISKSLNEIERKFQRDSSNTVDNNEATIQKNSVSTLKLHYLLQDHVRKIFNMNWVRSYLWLT